MFKCKEVGCGKTIRTVRDVTNCARCREAGRARKLAERHEDDDSLLLGAVIGAYFAQTFRPESEPRGYPADEAPVGGCGETAGGGAGGSWDAPSSDSGTTGGE